MLRSRLSRSLLLASQLSASVLFEKTEWNGTVTAEVAELISLGCDIVVHIQGRKKHGVRAKLRELSYVIAVSAPFFTGDGFVLNKEVDRQKWH